MQTGKANRTKESVAHLVWASVFGLFLTTLLVGFGLRRGALAEDDLPGFLLFSDRAGQLATLTTNGSFDPNNPFFQSLGTNGRSCASCHQASDAWSVTPSHIRARFRASNGTDPIFRPVDGANCPDSAGLVSTPPNASAYSLLLSKGLIRVSLPVPTGAQYTVSVVYDPYGCGLTNQNGQQMVSVYRRPLPATNLRFLSAVMFDGRETVQPLTSGSTFDQNLNTDLAHQVVDATLGHAQALSAPSTAAVQQIVDFELGTFTAQQTDSSAGDLTAIGALGGPRTLSQAPYFPGINDSLGGNPTGAAFDPNVFAIFSSWSGLHNAHSEDSGAARQSVARGEALFNTAPLLIQGVRGLNDALGQSVIVGTCGTCHDTPGVGNHSFPVPLDIGIADIAGAGNSLGLALSQLNSPNVPVFAVHCSTSLGAPSNETIFTTDPGRALISGRCADIGKFKGPILRALAARAPYFQNGSADTLKQVVDFYNLRFQMGLTPGQIDDLVAFLRSL